MGGIFFLMTMYVQEKQHAYSMKLAFKSTCCSYCYTHRNIEPLYVNGFLWIASYFVIYVNILYNADYLFTFIIIQFSDILQPVDVLVREDPFSLTCIRLFTDLTNNCLC